MAEDQKQTELAKLLKDESDEENTIVQFVQASNSEEKDRVSSLDEGGSQPYWIKLKGERTERCWILYSKWRLWCCIAHMTVVAILVIMVALLVVFKNGCTLQQSHNITASNGTDV